MQFFEIPQSVIDGVAAQIHAKTAKDYKIPVVGAPGNLETPQIFEIMPFVDIDRRTPRIFAVDGSRTSYSFYNGVAIHFYQAGYVCFEQGKEVRLNSDEGGVTLGKVFQGTKMLVLSEKDLSDIYDECLDLAPVKALLTFFDAPTDEIFGYKKDVLIGSPSNLLGFCQELLEWACVYDIFLNQQIATGDIVFRDGTLRSLHVKQRFLTKLGYAFHNKGIRILAITKQSPIKTELSYTFRKIDNYLQSKLRPSFPFKERDPRAQKLCCYFEVPEDVLECAYSGAASSMYAKKDIVGGRGFGLFFAARLDYVEKLQNYDWVVCDLNIYDCIPGIANKQLDRDGPVVAALLFELTATTQEHYILGYPYPLVEAHNLVALTGDFKQQAIARIKHCLYSSQYMDHTDIENLFLDIHSQF